tara:strand:+ start:177 stop:812 length:636 start_codon:yes stop_codon:yes gene_type:complete
MSQTEAQLIASSSVADGDIVGMSSSKLSGALPAISGASLTGVGVGSMEKMVSIGVNSNITCNSSTGTVFIPGNNSRFHSARGGPGTSFSSGFSIGNTSGVVTFPETGLYYLVLNIDGVVTFSNIRCQAATIHVCTDGSTFEVASQKGVCINRPTGTTSCQQCSTEYIFDVTNTSTHKAKFGCSPDDVGTFFLQADTTMFLSGFHIYKMRNT